MIVLHHLEKSRSFRIVWLLEELKLNYGLDYRLHIHKRDAETFLAPGELKELHPMGKAPILSDDSLPEGNQVLAESALIIEYLLKTYDVRHLFYPTEGQAWRDYTFWLHFAEGSLMPPAVMYLILSKAAEKTPFFARFVARKIRDTVAKVILSGNIRSALDLLESSLVGREYLAGAFGGADIQMYFAVAAVRQRMGLENRPNIAAWLARCEERAGFVHAVEASGPVFG